MLSMPTTTVSVMRGTSADEYGDEVDTNKTISSGVPCSLLEQSRFTYDQSTSTPMFIRTIIGRVGGDQDIKENDRLLDELTQEIYMVLATSQVQSPMIVSDIRLELKRVGNRN